MSPTYNSCYRPWATILEIGQCSSTNPTLPAVKTFHLRYAKEGCGHDFSSRYKYSDSTRKEASRSSTQFTRAIYAKDARGVALDSPLSVYHANEEEPLLGNRRRSVFGDDGEFRNLYDLGQRIRGLRYWMELRALQKER